MTESIVIFTRYGAYEPGNRYYIAIPPGGAAGNIAAGLADAQTELQTTSVLVNRWEHLDSFGKKIGEGALNEAGKVSGDFSEFRYCSFLRLNSKGPLRPSSKFVHALPESALANGVPTTLWKTQVGAYESGLLAAGVADSDGSSITSVTFVRGSRRKNVRIVP